MEKEIIINNKIINYKELKEQNVFIYNNLKRIIKGILKTKPAIELINIKENEFAVSQDGKILCNFTIIDGYYYIIKMNKDNILYEYFVELTEGKIVVSLKKCSFCYNDIDYNIIRYGYIQLIDITDNNIGITIELEDVLKNEQELIELINNINLNDRIKDIYDKLNKKIKSFDNLKIEKYQKLNNCNFNKKTTDLLILNNGVLIDFLTTIKKEDREYAIKKENSNYSFTFYNSSIDAFTTSYFEFNEQLKFVKKLEKKK